MELPGDGLTVITYTAAADSHAQQQLDFLASWSTQAGPQQPSAQQATE
jgi:hypothetical protein